MRRAGWLWLAVLLAACGGGAALDADGPARTYRLGEPDVAVAAAQSGAGELSVALVIEPSSLSFRSAPRGVEAVAEWTLRVVVEGETLLLQGADTVRAATEADARTAPPVTVARHVPTGSGRVRVEALVTDARTDRTARRTASAFVRDPASGPWVGDILLTRAGRPVAATRVPARTDTLRATAVAASVPDGATLKATVLQTRGDTVAAPPGGPPPDAPVLPRSVVRDSVWGRRQAIDAGAVVPVEVDLPALGEGAYSVVLSVVGPGGVGLASSSRQIVVRRRDFPSVTRLSDLVAPLALLAEPNEMAALRRGGRRGFDAFWGRQIDDRRRAAETLQTFYERVEAANRLFSTAQEGWATDRGRVYVLFGPPASVQTTPSGETWTYGRARAAPPEVVFDRAGPPAGPSLPTFNRRTGGRFDVLQRLARASWRAGRVP